MYIVQFNVRMWKWPIVYNYEPSICCLNGLDAMYERVNPIFV